MGYQRRVHGQMAQQLQQNPQQLLTVVTQILNQMGAGGAVGGEPDGQEFVGDQAQAGASSGAQQVQVPMTPEETEAVQGLEAMFPHIPHSEVLQTFKACGNDASLAANMLFDYNPAVM